jgi:hypothetical protein
LGVRQVGGQGFIDGQQAVIARVLVGPPAWVAGRRCALGQTLLKFALSAAQLEVQSGGLQVEFGHLLGQYLALALRCGEHHWRGECLL